jgi:nucleoside-diphosphate-sugar epimerase
MNTKFAFVTGSAGFVGSSLVGRLVSDGWNIRVLDNFSSGRMENIEHQRESRKVEILRRDLKTLKGWRNQLKMNLNQRCLHSRSSEAVLV